MKKILIVEDEIIIANRIKELIDQIKKEVPNFVLFGIYSFEDKEAGIKVVNSMEKHFKPLKQAEILSVQENTCKAKSIFLKGKYFEQVNYKDISKVLLSKHSFLNKEIQFEEITIIQSFNHIKRNTIIFKFKQPHTFFIIRNTIENILKILPPYFEKVHQSFIINPHYITARRNEQYITVVNEKVPVGKMFKNIP